MDTLNWNDLWVALALVLVIEGIIPFLSPTSLRKVLVMMSQRDDRSIRLGGFVSMVVGLLLLYWAKD
jgi:uncharacterized protein YjeT (DUF2065 family)